MYSINTYNGSGGAAPYAVSFPYLSKDHVEVRIDGVLQTSGYSWINSSTLSLTAPAGLNNVDIRRVTPAQLPEVVFNDGSTLTDTDLNLEALQLLYIAQETADSITDTNNRTVHYPVGEVNTSGSLPVAAQRAQMLLGFDALGNATTVPLPASVGAGDLRWDTFIAGTDFTAGSSTSVTLSRAPGTAANVEVFFDGGFQGPDQIASLVGTVLTFTSPIPTGVQRVFVRSGTTISLYVPPQGSVNDAACATGSKLLNRVNDRVSVTDFGANQVLDASAAFTAAANYCNAKGGGTVYIPPGTWHLASTVPSYPGVEFVGAGENATTLVPTTQDMTVFSCIFAVLTMTHNGFRDFTIHPSVTGVTGIKLVLCRYSAITNITFLGCLNNFYIDRGYFFTLANLTSTSVDSNLRAGSGILTSTVDTDYVFHATIANYKLVSQGLGAPDTGLYLRRAIDFQITDLHAYGVSPNCTVVVLENDCQAVKMKGLNIDGCGAGILLQRGLGVDAYPSFTSIANSHVDQPSAYGIRVNGATRTTIHDVMFTPTGAHVDALPIDLINDNWTSIIGCQLSGFSGNAAIQLTGSRLGRISNNIISQCLIGVGFSGSPTGMAVEGNTFDTVPNPIGGSPAGVGNRIKPSQYGLTPSTALVATSPAVPASGVAYTNNTGFTCRVSIMGGTFSGVTLNGIAVGVSGNNWSGEVQPDETLAITYSVAPNWWWVGK